MADVACQRAGPPAVRSVSLQADALGCHACAADRYGFELAPNSNGYLKFPATIGATGKATLPFVGINPYRNDRNRLLYTDAMASLDAFCTLAGNREPCPSISTAPRYIRRYQDGEQPRYGREPYYRQCMDIIEGVWGAATPFEAHAAATELYLCSTADASGSAFSPNSPCADTFFTRTFRQVQPEAVITVGRAPRRYMRKRHALQPVTSSSESPYRAKIDGREVWVFDIHHNQARVPGSVRTGAVRHAIDGIRNLAHHGRDPARLPLIELFPPQKPGTRPQPTAASPSAAELATARARLTAGLAYTDGRVYGIYRPKEPHKRPQYGAYLAAWAVRQALGYDKADVRISTELDGSGYRFRIVPVRPLRAAQEQ